MIYNFFDKKAEGGAADKSAIKSKKYIKLTVAVKEFNFYYVLLIFIVNILELLL